MDVILSIQPYFCKLIFSGQKKYEYRKRIFKRSDIDKVYIYASTPIRRIVGFFTIDKVIEDTPSNIWLKTHKEGGITKEFLDEYFSNCHTAYAIKIKSTIQFTEPIAPQTVLDNFRAPQSFMYVTNIHKPSLIATKTPK